MILYMMVSVYVRGLDVIVRLSKLWILLITWNFLFMNHKTVLFENCYCALGKELMRLLFKASSKKFESHNMFEFN